MAIDWAILPAAGRGTRMYPASAVIPKSLIPVGNLPMFHSALEEALDAGIPGVVIVVSPGQELLRDYVDAAVEGKGGEELAILGRKLAGAELRWVEQTVPRGVGDAFMLCRRITGASDFAVVLPDNWFDAPQPAIAQVSRTFRTTGTCTLGLTRVEPEEAHLFGNVGGVELESLEGEDSFRVLRLQDKLPGTYADRGAVPTLRGCARYVLNPGFYDALEATGPPAAGEWDDVPAFQYLVDGPGLLGHRIRGRHFDVGIPAGHLAAAAYLHGRGQDQR